MNDDIERLMSGLCAARCGAGSAPAGARGGGGPIASGAVALAAAIGAGRGGVARCGDCAKHLGQPSGRPPLGRASRSAADGKARRPAGDSRNTTPVLQQLIAEWQNPAIKPRPMVAVVRRVARPVVTVLC